MVFRFNPEADAELTEAREWYSHQRKDLDVEFTQCIDDALSRIADNPYLFPRVYRELRRAIVHRFPFAIIYHITPDELQVISIFHSSRDPRLWKGRMFGK